MESPDPNTELAQHYERSLREVISEVDRLAAETKAIQDAAVNEILATKEERRKIEQSSDVIAREILAARSKEMEAEIHRTLVVEYITKLLQAGRTRQEISAWLDIPEDLVYKVWSSLVSSYPGNIDMDAMVEIIQSGRGGMINVMQGDRVLKFHWEFGGGNALALIFVPDEKTWEAKTDIPLAKRIEFLDWVAQQVIHQKASGSLYRIVDDVIEILQRN